MKAKFLHNNFNVLDLDKSLAFYKEALGLTEKRRLETPGFILVYLTDGQTSHELELTYLKDRKEPYNLGDNEFHLAFGVDDLKPSTRNMRKWAASVSKPADGHLFYRRPRPLLAGNHPQQPLIYV